MSGRVAWITYAPVKGLGLAHVDEVDLEADGVRYNRRFYLIGDDGRLVNGKLAGTLVQVAASADLDGTTLALRFPDGSVVDGDVELGGPVETNFYGRPVAGHARRRRVRRRSFVVRRSSTTGGQGGSAGRRLGSRRRGERLDGFDGNARAPRTRGR